MIEAVGRLGLGSLARPRLDPARCLWVQSARVLAPGEEVRHPAGVVIGVASLVYRWIDLASIPKSKQRQSLAAQLRAWSPFAESGFRVAWFGSSAGLFAWDAAKLRRRLADAGFGDKALPVLPEPWLYLQPAQDAVRLIRVAEGFEAQWWHGSALRASRWWPEPPEESDWLNFQRGAGVAPMAVIAIERALQDAGAARAEGWGRLLSESDLRSPAAAWEPLALAAVSLVLMGWTAVLAQQHWATERQRRDAEERLVQARAKAGPVLALREAALADAQRASALAGEFARPEPLAVIEHLLNRLPRVAGLQVRQIEVDGHQVRLALDVPSTLERSAIVAALEEGGWLGDVREARDLGGGTLNLAMQLRTDRPPANRGPAVAAPPAAVGDIPASAQKPSGPSATAGGAR